MSATIPTHLVQDRYWKSLIYLFQEHPKLNQCFTSRYFNFEEETIKVKSLQSVSAPWSHSEKIMLRLALHLFNERHRFNLSDFDWLDDNNKQLAYRAISMRFQ